MDTLLIDTISRLVHVGTAIVLIGGTVFMLFILLPAAQQLPESEHEALRKRLIGRWRRFVHAGIVLFLLSGSYNYLVVMRPQHEGDGLYHALVGIKILLALVIFFLASALVGRSQAFNRMRRNRKTWLAAIVLLAVVVVAISGFVKVRGLGHSIPSLPNNESASAAEAHF